MLIVILLDFLVIWYSFNLFFLTNELINGNYIKLLNWIYITNLSHIINMNYKDQQAWVLIDFGWEKMVILYIFTLTKS